MLFADFSQFYWSFTLFCREFFGANIFGPFLYLCYFNRFFHLWRLTLIKVKRVIYIYLCIWEQWLQWYCENDDGDYNAVLEDANGNDANDNDDNDDDANDDDANDDNDAIDNDDSDNVGDGNL